VRRDERGHDANQSEPGLFSRRYAALTGGLFALVAFVAFEATAVVTIMPGVAAELDGLRYYSLVSPRRWQAASSGWSSPAAGATGVARSPRWQPR
jgi:hypothetical protein